MPARQAKRSVSASRGLPEEKRLAVSEEPTPQGASKEEAPVADELLPLDANRFASQELVQDVVIGYTGDNDEDPPQAGACRDAQSGGIQRMVAEKMDVPIAKDQRARYVWVAAARIDRRGEESEGELRKKYTWNPDEIRPVDGSKVDLSRLRCDVCGVVCNQEIYEFRCYARLRPDEPRPSSGRRLHSFVSYISKECGKGLLGLASGASKLRERIYRLLMESDGLVAVEELEDVWRNGTEVMRQILTDELRFLSKTEAGLPRRALELKKASALHGELQRLGEDVFRAVARGTAPLTARDLAAVTILHAEAQEEGLVARPSGGGAAGGRYLLQVAEALRSRQALPAAPVQWPRAEVVSSLQALADAWHLRVRLEDALHGAQEFIHQKSESKQKKRKKEKEAKEVPLLRLVYLPGCQELHALVAQSYPRERIQALKKKREDVLKQCREDFAPLEAAHHARYSRAEDRAIHVPEKDISFEQVRLALNQITWPNCFTRNNVRPDGAPFIEAFPLGVVLNYALGLVCSRPTRLWPNLSKLLAKFIAQEQPDFRYTTVQLNKNYATKMHVDGNNHGPSFIIGLGDYTGGEVWIMDENGTVEMELPCSMRGWPHLRPGTKLRGRLEDCHNKWVKFDGNTPHMTMPYTGSRISIVFFTRRGWLTMLPETKASLEETGFQLPGEDFMNLSTVRVDANDTEKDSKAKKVAKAPRLEVVQEKELSDDEVDEDEKVDEVLRAEQDAASWPAWDWASRLQEHLSFRARDLEVACFGSATVFGLALQELLASVRLASCTEQEGVAMRLLKRSCKPLHQFHTLDAALARQGQCYVHKRVCTAEKPAGSEDLVFGSFSCEPFLNQDPSRPSCFNDPRTKAFRALRAYLVAQRPRAALLLVEGWQKIPEASRPSVRSFLLDGKDPRLRDADQEAHWGLARLQGYGVAFLPVSLADCGVPLSGTDAYVLLLREDCGGPAAAQKAAQLVRSVLEAGVLPRASAHALMFTSEDPRVVQAQKEIKEVQPKAKGRRRTMAGLQRKMLNESRELGLSPGEAPYTDHLRQNKNAAGRKGFSGDKWLRQASDDQASLVNLIFARARHDGLDLQNLCADLSQGFLPFARRDDGLLPAAKAEPESMPDFYSFSHHRALTGQELMLCQGFPIWRMDLLGVSDAEARQMAGRSAAVPGCGLCIAALLSVASLPGQQKLPEERLADLLKEVKEVKELKEEVKEEVVEASVDAEGARLENRAAALLNLMSHGDFAQGAAPKRKEAPKGILSALSEVAKDNDLEDTVGATKIEAKEESETDVVETLDWSVRLRKLHVGLEAMSMETVLKWLSEAVEDTEAELSSDLIRAAAAEFLQRVCRDEAVSEVLFRQRFELINKLKATGFSELAEDVDVAMRASQLAKSFARGAQKVCIEEQSSEGMKHYVQTIVRGCDRKGWFMRRVFLKHLTDVATRAFEGEVTVAAKAAECLVEFGDAGGWSYIISWLKETPNDRWPSRAALEQLASVLPSRVPVQLLAGLYGKAVGATKRIERVLSKALAPGLETADAEAMSLLKELTAFGGALSQRLERSAALVALQAEVREATDLQTWRSLDERLRALPEVEGFQQLAQVEANCMKTLQGLVEQNLKSAMEQEDEKQKQEEEVKRGEALEHLEQCRVALSSHLNFKEASGLKRCLAKMKSFRDAMQKVTQVPTDCRELWDRAREAVERFSERSFRSSKAFLWLRERHLGHIARVLDEKNLLDTLHLIRAHDLDGLPYRCQELLLTALEELSEDTLRPREVPKGWERRSSRHLALQYFQREGAKDMQWEWPLPSELPQWRNDGRDVTSEIWQQKDEEHALKASKASRGSPCVADEHWRDAADRLAAVCLELHGVEEGRHVGLVSAWRGELWQTMKLPPLPVEVLAPFWRDVLLPQLYPSKPSDRESIKGLRAVLLEALKVARADATDLSGEKALSAASASMALQLRDLDGPKMPRAVAALKQLRLALIQLLHTGSELVDRGLEVMRKAQAAIIQVAKEPTFEEAARAWLKSQGLQACYQLLKERGVLASLARGDVIEAHASACLPTYCVERLSQAWRSDGALRRLRAAKRPSAGWDVVFSRSVGLFYYAAGNGKAQWMYPAAVVEDEPLEVPNPLLGWPRGSSQKGCAPYVEMERGEVSCLLCQMRGLEHFAGPSHASEVASWSAMLRRLSFLHEELESQRTLTGHETAVAKVWRSEIQRSLSDSKVGQVYWHLLGFKATQLQELEEELAHGLSIANQPEPEWSKIDWKPAPPPEPDEDFPWPRASLKLAPETPREVFDALSAQALQREGIARQPTAVPWCLFCDKAVPRLAAHLDRSSLEAKLHLEAKHAAQHVVEKLRMEGYELQKEGLSISKRRYYCGLCNASGSWQWIFDHKSSRPHRDAYESFMTSSSAAATQARINGERLKEVQKSLWAMVFEAMGT